MHYYRTAQDRKYEAARARQMTEEIMAKRAPEIPTVDLKWCDYHQATKKLTLASEFMGMPRQFFVKSHHTGKEVRFVEIGPEDKMYDEDGFDGEQKIYRPTTPVPNVDYLVIYNQY